MWFMWLSSEDFGQSSVNDGKKFLSGFINELKLNKSYIWQMMGFDKFFMTFILSKLTIEELNHTVTAPRDSFFYFIGLPLHTARHHWWIVGPMIIILMVKNSRLVSWNYFNQFKRVLMIFWWRSKYFLLSDRIEPMGSHIKEILTDRKESYWTGL